MKKYATNKAKISNYIFFVYTSNKGLDRIILTVIIHT